MADAKESFESVIQEENIAFVQQCWLHVHQPRPPLLGTPYLTSCWRNEKFGPETQTCARPYRQLAADLFESVPGANC